MRIIGNDQKNNGQNFWEILERIIGKISSIIGAGLLLVGWGRVRSLLSRRELSHYKSSMVDSISLVMSGTVIMYSGIIMCDA